MLLGVNESNEGEPVVLPDVENYDVTSENVVCDPRSTDMRQVASLRYKRKYPSSSKPRFDPHATHTKTQKEHTTAATITYSDAAKPVSKSAWDRFKKRNTLLHK